VKAGVKGLLTTALFIDDIGSEPVYSHFGNSANIIGEIIIRRYEKGSLTHGTSNLSTDELKQLYGIRVYDRMREMFNDIIIKGESRR
jgi:DNA replication protein DnaC